MEGANTELAKSELKAVFWEAPGDTHSCLYILPSFYITLKKAVVQTLCVCLWCVAGILIIAVRPCSSLWYWKGFLLALTLHEILCYQLSTSCHKALGLAHFSSSPPLQSPSTGKRSQIQCCHSLSALFTWFLSIYGQSKNVKSSQSLGMSLNIFALLIFLRRAAFFPPLLADLI